MITTCTTCGKAYEAGSEEQANEPIRECLTCRHLHDRGTDRLLADIARHDGRHPSTCECTECCYRRKHPQLRPRHEPEPDYGGVLGADGQVYSDADPGL